MKQLSKTTFWYTPDDDGTTVTGGRVEELSDGDIRLHYPRHALVKAGLSAPLDDWSLTASTSGDDGAYGTHYDGSVAETSIGSGTISLLVPQGPVMLP